MRKLSKYIVGDDPSGDPHGRYIVLESHTGKPYAGDAGIHYADYFDAQARCGHLNLPAKDREKSAATPPSPPSAKASATTGGAPTVDEGGGETDHAPIVIEPVDPEPGEARAVACPTCKAERGHPCVTRSGLEVQGYDVHSPRAKAWAEQQAKAARAAATAEECAA